VGVGVGIVVGVPVAAGVLVGPGVGFGAQRACRELSLACSAPWDDESFGQPPGSAPVPNAPNRSVRERANPPATTNAADLTGPIRLPPLPWIPHLANAGGGPSLARFRLLSSAWAFA
jgi:hypothetical protein